MKRQILLQGIIENFNLCAQTFQKKSNGICNELFSLFRAEESIEDIRMHFSKIYYNNFILLFKYTAHCGFTTINSILECLVYFEKTQDATGYPLACVLDYLDADTLDCLAIPCISNGTAMKQAFEMLGNTILCYWENICELSYSPEKKKELDAKFTKEILTAFKKDTADEEDLQRYKTIFYDWFTARAVSPAYIDFMTGRYPAAVKKFRKMKNKNGYENRIMALMAQAGAGKKHIPASVYDNLTKYNAFGVPKANAKEFAAIFLPAFLWTLVWAVPFGLVFFLFYFLEQKGALYLMGPLAMAPSIFLPSFLMGLASSYFTRHQAFRRLFKKDYQAFSEMDSIENGKSSDRFMKGFTSLLLAGGFIFTVLTVRCNLKFEADGFIDNTKFFSMQGIYYSYSDIDRLYYKASRQNGSGEKMNFPSYAIVLKNGKEIDFYEWETAADTEHTLLPLLKTKGVTVEKETK